MLFEKESNRVEKLRKLADKIVSTVSERTALFKSLQEKVRDFRFYHFLYIIDLVSD